VPDTGERIEHVQDKPQEALVYDYEMVPCPVCKNVHFVNLQTAKLLGHKDQGGTSELASATCC